MFFPFEATPMAVSGRLGPYNGPSSSSSTNGHATGSKASGAFSNGNHDDDFNTKDTHVPIWAWVLVGIGAALVAVFFVSFSHNALRERRVARKDNRKPRYGRAALDGLKFALFFWVFAAIAQGVRTVLGRGKKASAITSYSKVGNPNADNKDARSSRSYNGSMAYGGGSADNDDMTEEPWSSAAYGDGGSGQYDASSAKYEPYSSGNIDNTNNTGTTAVSVGSTIPPYSPNSAFTSVGNSSTTTSANNVPPPVHITPAISPMVTPLPTPAAVTEPLMSSISSSTTPSATYVPGHDSRPLY